MTRTLGIAGAVAGMCLLACTRPNPAYWMVQSGDADLQQPDLQQPDPLPPDAAAILRGDGEPPPAPDAADPSPDAAVASPPDVGADLVARDLGADAFVPPAGCGLGTIDVSGVKDADGVVVDDDGTIYVLTDDATNSYIGRLRMGQAPELKWLTIVSSPVTWGLALDRARERLYVLVVSGVGALVAFDGIKGTPTGRMVVSGLQNPNDVVVAPDGNVYLSNQGDRSVYQVGPNGGPMTLISTTPFGDTVNQMPAALTVDASGNLIVGIEPGGPLYRVAMANGRQLSRSPIPNWNGWANGLTTDRKGRLYVGIYDDTQPRTVVRLEPDGKTTTIATNGRFSSIDFGRGPLDCRDLYVTDPFGAMRRVHVADAF